LLPPEKIAPNNSIRRTGNAIDQKRVPLLLRYVFKLADRSLAIIFRFRSSPPVDSPR
jgi:hypothetical protein